MRVEDLQDGVTRREVLGASAVAAFGISSRALPAAFAASTGGAAARSGFIQIDEFAAADVGGTNPSSDVQRSFVYGGVLYFLDLDSWKVYEFSGALVPRVVTITGVPAGSWYGGSSNIVLSGSQAFISSLHGDGDKLVVVRLDLPLASTTVAATTQTIDLSGRLGTVDLAGESWTVDDSGTAVTIAGTDLIDGTTNPAYPNWPTGYESSDVTFDVVQVLPVLSHDGTNLRCMIELSLSDEGNEPYYIRQASPLRYWTLEIRPIELVTIPPSLSGTATFAAIETNMSVTGIAGGGSFPGDPATNVAAASTIVVQRSGDLIVVNDSASSASIATRIPLSAPTSHSAVTNVSLPTGLSDFSIETSVGNFIRIGDLLYVPAEVYIEEAGVPTSRTGVLRIDLSQSGLPVTAYGVVPDSDTNPTGLIAVDDSYLYVGYYDPVTPWPFGVARLDLSTLAWDASALVELDNSSDHYGYTAQVASSAVVSAGGGTVAFTTFGYVAPS